MARGFAATLGAGTTDAVTTTLSTDGTNRSYHLWVNRRAAGGNTFGRLFDQVAATNIFDNNGSNWQFGQAFDGTVGAWTWAMIADNTWTAIGLSYNRSATTNDPIVYQGGSKLTVGSGVTETSTPVGTAINGAGGYIIGNRAAADRNWDGMLAEFAIWDAILDDGEFSSLAKGYSPQLIRTSALVEYVPMVRSNVSLKLAAPTVTGTAIQPHPRIIMPSTKGQRFKATAAPTGRIFRLAGYGGGLVGPQVGLAG